MPPVRRAVIDVGTNSIKLLVAEIDGRRIVPLCEESCQTRLGRGFYPQLLLQPGPIADSAGAVAEFARKANRMGVPEPRVIATSAVREARNQGEFVAAVNQASGLALRIITGDQEAGYAFEGVTTDPDLANEPLLLLDVGGGSTEFILGRGRETHFAESFPVGTVRLLENAPVSDPPTAEQLRECRQTVHRFIQEQVGPKLLRALKRETQRLGSSHSVQLVGTGGTASILGCMEAELSTFDRQRLESTRISRARSRWHVERLWGVPLEERRLLVGLPPNRADVILTGSVIYEAVMAYFEFDQLRISTRGLRFAVLLESR